MAIVPAFLRPVLLFAIFIVICPMTTFSLSEAEALLNFKGSLTVSNDALHNWVANSEPCGKENQWVGILCYNGFAMGLRLEGMGLSGKIDVHSLLDVKGLRIISLKNNSLSGSIPEFNRIGFLRAIYLSGNQFSGEIPSDYFHKMGSLKKLWLSNNKFTGKIPQSLAQIAPLIELHLENNQFTGIIPNIDGKSLVEFNVANNQLEGEIPSGLLKFGESSFGGNSGLCGEKLGKACEEKVENPNPEVSQDDAATSNNNNGNVSDSSSSKVRQVKIGVIVASGVLLVSLLVFFVVRSRRKKEEIDMTVRDSAESIEESVEVRVSPSARRDMVSMRRLSTSSNNKRGSRGGGGSRGSGCGIGELVLVNEEKGIFGLVDLMKASAEVLGNGGLGSSYKAVMANGVAVAVKRMKDMNALGKEGFDAEMRRLAGLKHWNILTPLAFLYRKEEKLVVLEYVPKGSLLFLLHGDRGPSHAELDWPARLKIVQGIAKGMGYLHTELASYDLPHGNLKSSNVLLGPDYEPLLVDYGFSPMVNPANLAQALCAYKAPEAVYGQISPKCDVYCLGVVILEIFTGKFPCQYLSNSKGGTDVVQWVASAISEGRELDLLDPEIATARNSLGQMRQLLHIGFACTVSNPEQRLDMTEAIRRIEEIKEVECNESRTMEVLPSPMDGYADSRSSI